MQKLRDVRYTYLGLGVAMGLGLSLAGCGGGGGSTLLPETRNIIYSSTAQDPQGDIYLLGENGAGMPVRITNTPEQNYSPALSEDGQKVAYIEANQNGSAASLWVVTLGANGTPVENSRRRLTQDAFGAEQPCWSPDGTTIAFVRSVADTENDNPAGIYTVPATGGDVSLLIGEGARNPGYDPTNQAKIAFTLRSQATGLDTLYTQTGTNTSSRVVLTTCSDRLDTISGLSWSPDGTQLVYSIYRGAGDGALKLISAQGGVPTALPGSPVDAGGPSWLGSQWMVFYALETDGRHALYTLTVQGNVPVGTPTLLYADGGDITRSGFPK